MVSAALTLSLFSKVTLPYIIHCLLDLSIFFSDVKNVEVGYIVISVFLGVAWVGVDIMVSDMMLPHFFE